MTKRPFLALLLLIAPFSASAQNLLVNPGFDGGLLGWDFSTTSYGNGRASAVWTSTDVLGQPGSGSARFQVSSSSAFSRDGASGRLSQCVAVEPGKLYSVGGRFRIDTARGGGMSVGVDLFSDAGCGVARGTAYGAYVLPRSGCYSVNMNSGGAWIQTVSLPLSPGDARSALVYIQADGDTVGYCSFADVDGLADGLFFEAVQPASVTWLLPTSARIPGVNGSLWTTDLTLSNAAATGALVTIKLLGHDVDGRNAEQRTLLVPPLQTVTVKDILGSLFQRDVDYGALLVLASPGLAVLAENTTPVGGACGSGGVGESLPAAGPSDLVGETPKALFPIRENAAYRTNLVLASASEVPTTVHMKLSAPDGTVVGESDIDLPPLGMKQVNRIAAVLGASALDGGRLEVSTATEGGLFAAYASLIDNTTNDPRALLPR
jgi:hypothetical protein